jgi:hypothetical protein
LTTPVGGRRGRIYKQRLTVDQPIQEQVEIYEVYR